MNAAELKASLLDNLSRMQDEAEECEARLRKLHDDIAKQKGAVYACAMLIAEAAKEATAKKDSEHVA